MSRYQQHRHQMVETHIKQYLPPAHGTYGEKQMMCNLRILTNSPAASNASVHHSKNS